MNVNSVESLYYCSDVIASVAERQAAARDENPEQLFEQACDNALGKVTDDLANSMAARRCERLVRRRVLSRIPSWRQLKGGASSQSIVVSGDTEFVKEQAKFGELFSAKNLDGLIALYPLRHSEVFAEIARTLKCLGRDDYEKMAVTQIRKDESLAQKLRARIGPLSSAIVS